MFSLETRKMSALETEGRSSAETRQVSTVETIQYRCLLLRLDRFLLLKQNKFDKFRQGRPSDISAVSPADISSASTAYSYIKAEGCIGFILGATETLPILCCKSTHNLGHSQRSRWSDENAHTSCWRHPPSTHAGRGLCELINKTLKLWHPNHCHFSPLV